MQNDTTRELARLRALDTLTLFAERGRLARIVQRERVRGDQLARDLLRAHARSRTLRANFQRDVSE